MPQRIHFALEMASRILDVLDQRLAGCVPAFALGVVEPLDCLAQLVPRGLRESQTQPMADWASQMLMNLDGRANGLPPQ
jgi:hypothetical protein